MCSINMSLHDPLLNVKATNIGLSELQVKRNPPYELKNVVYGDVSKHLQLGWPEDYLREILQYQIDN